MELRRVLSYMRRAVDDYEMIREGDRIAVGVSAGKDSLTLLAGLAALRRFYPKKFELVAITVDMGFKEPMDFTPIEAFCRQLDVPYHIAKTEIATIIFDIRKEKSPCALCAKMRRGVLNNTARDLGCNVVALGHHFDDVVDTFMMNLFFEGRIGCFQPVTDLERVGVRVIRPMLYMPEKHVRGFANKEELPVVKSHCPADGNTERTEMSRTLAELGGKYKDLRFRIFSAIQKGKVDGFFEPPYRPRQKSRREPPEDGE